MSRHKAAYLFYESIFENATYIIVFFKRIIVLNINYNRFLNGLDYVQYLQMVNILVIYCRLKELQVHGLNKPGFLLIR